MRLLSRPMAALFILVMVGCKPSSKEATTSVEEEAVLNSVIGGTQNSVEFGEVDVLLLNQKGKADVCCQIQMRQKNGVVKNLSLITGKDAVVINFFFPDRHEYRSSLEMVDLNKDGLDDAIVHSVFMPGAGPQAGMEIDMYSCFLQKKGNLIPSDYLPNVPCADRDKYLSHRDYYLKYRHLPVGIEIAETDRDTYDLKQGEKLIFSMTIEKSGKFVTVAVQEHLEYLVYRFGDEKSVELEVMERKADKLRRFLYYSELNYGYKRFEYRHLVFGNDTYRYTVFNNIDEHDKMDGDGVMVENLKIKKIVTLRASGARGSLGLLEGIPWLKKEVVTGDDYEDER